VVRGSGDSSGEVGPDLRILILSTPKTGSTWLRSLLSGIYRLPQLYLEPGFDCVALNRGGTRWVAQYHLRPHAELTAWIREQHAIPITTIRHPADVLISLFHHLRSFRAQSIDFDFVRRMLSASFDRGNITTDSSGQPFWADLAFSLDWMSEAGTHVVRYEDLRSDPPGTLRELTSRISAVPDERIEAAIEMSDLLLMRALAGRFGGFFREGRIGSWRDLLPPDVIEVFRSVAPYAGQVAALGYSMDPADPMINRTLPSRPRHPMATLQRFENSAAVAPVLVQCFFWARGEQRAHWQEQLAAAGPSSFYDWLNLPCAPAGRGLYQELPLSNLAAFVYGQRPDVRMVYPDLTGSNRYEYAQWFLSYAETEYGLDRPFVDSQRAGLSRWAGAPCNVDGAGIYAGLPLSNLAADLYDRRADLQRAYPDLTGSGRYEYAQWFLRHAETEYGLDPAFIHSQRAGLLRWADTPCNIDGAGIYAGLPLSNLAAYIYDRRVDLQRAYLDLTGSDRYDYAQWFLSYAETEYGLDRAFIDSQRAGLLRWADTPCNIDGAGIYAGLPLSNLAAYLYDRRADLQRAYSDLTGSDRYGYLQWFLRYAETEYGLDRAFVDSQRAGLLGWADAPCNIDGVGIYAGLAVSNLAAYLYDRRADLQRAYPDLTGSDRYGYLQWFLQYAETEYGLDRAFVDSQRAGLLRWAGAPCNIDGAGIYAGLPVSNLAAYIYDRRADLQRAYPDLTGSDRYGYLQWFLRYAETEYGLDRAFVDAQRAALLSWVGAPCNIDGAGIYAGLPVSNLAAYIHDQRADLQRAYTDLTGSGRYGYLQWFLRHAETEDGLDRAFVDSQRAGLLNWANAPCNIDGAGIYAGLPVSNLAAYIHDQRADLRQAYPDLTGSDRYGYVQWFLRYAETEYGLDRAFVDAQRAGLLRWAGAPCNIDGAGIYAGLPVSNLAAYLYDRRADLRQAYPDLTGSDRYRYLQWFLRHAAQTDWGLDADCIHSVRSGLVRWANATTSIDGIAAAANFVWHICQTRTDVLGSFPLIRGDERRHLVLSVVSAAKALGMDAEYIMPLERSLGRHWVPEIIRRRILPEPRLPSYISYLPE